ncbi:MAG: ABC transporter ATP-binding protein [Anaerolineales bacterium]|jgi:iron complex transport system ATP-binding protein
MLKIRSLSVQYGERPVLREVSLDLKRGEVLALIGPNGSGKSTLVRAVSGVIPVAHGYIRVDGQDVTHLSPMQRARKIAVVPQAISLPPAFTVWQTVLMGRTPYLNFLGQLSQRDKEIVNQALTRVQALHLAQRQVGDLSGGEAQRILLARALAQSTPILLMDEPTAHLDLKYQVSMLHMIRELAHHDGLAILLVLHDLNLAAEYADRLALLAEGQITAIGSAGEVLVADLISPTYGLPVQVVSHPLHGRPFVTALGAPQV